MKKLILNSLIILSVCFTAYAQSDWQFIDCFDQFEPNFATGPFNLDATDLYLDNQGQPWVFVQVDNESKIGRLVNGQWEYSNIPNNLPFPFPLPNPLTAVMAFDDNNVLWVTDGWGAVGSFPGVGVLYSFQNGVFTSVTGTEGIRDLAKFENDPLLYLIFADRVATMNPSNPGVITDIYVQPGSATNISRVAKSPSGDVIINAYSGAQNDSLFVVNGQGLVTGYDLSPAMDQLPQGPGIRDMSVDSNGDVWFYNTSGFVHSLTRFDFSDAESFSLNTPASIPDATCRNMVMDGNDVIWLFYEGFVVQFANGVFTVEEADAAPSWTTMGYSNMHFRKDSNNNIWYIGILAPNGRYGLVVANPGGLHTLSGNTFIDWNQNQVFDAGDAPAPLTIQAGSNYVMSLPNGAYQVFLADPNVPITVAAAPQANFSFTTSDSYTLTPANGPTSGLDFGIYPSQTVQDLAVTATTGPCRPGFTLNQWLTYENNGTTISDAEVILDIAAELSFISANPSPTSVNGNQLVWNTTGIQPFENHSIYVQLQVDVNATLGDTLQNSVSVSPLNQDETPVDNHFVIDLPVVGSFDPNDKTATPDEITAADEWIDYRIRFQNTGTDTAFNIHLTDTISFNLNQSTLEIVGASHPMRYALTNSVLEFWFDDILLPDSNTNEALSHGFVMYRIKSNHDLQPADEVHNTAYIYFDFNQPIVTNTTVNAVPFPDGVAEHSNDNLFTVYPNPNEGNFALQLKETDSKAAQLIIHNSLGQQVFHASYLSNGNRISVNAELPSGIYFVKVVTGSGESSQKMVVR